MTFGSYHLRYSAAMPASRLTTDMPIAYLREEVSFLLDRPVHLIIGSDERAAGARRSRRARLSRGDDRLLERLGARSRRAVRLAGGGDPRRHHAQAVQLRGHRRHPRRAHDIDTRSARAAAATGITAFAGRAMPISPSMSLNRLGATPRWRISSPISSIACFRRTMRIPGAALSDRAGHAARGIRSDRARRLSRHGPGARRQCRASSQRQNDIYGSVILAAAQMFWDQRLPRPGDRRRSIIASSPSA